MNSTNISNPNGTSRYNNLSNSTPTFNLTTKMGQPTEIMKPTDNQKHLIYDLVDEITSWSGTNDINSPSHWSLIEGFVNEELCSHRFENENDTRARLVNALSEFLYCIRKVK